MNSIEGLFCLKITKRTLFFLNLNIEKGDKEIEKQDRGKMKSLQVYLIEGNERTKEEKEKELECFNGFVDTLTLLIRKYGNRVLNK